MYFVFMYKTWRGNGRDGEEREWEIYRYSVMMVFYFVIEQIYLLNIMTHRANKQRILFIIDIFSCSI